MANSENSSNTAIVALIIIGLAVAAGVFFYFQGGYGKSEVIKQDSTTIIEKQVPAPEPTEEAEPGYKFEHEDSEGDKTTIEAPP